MSMRWVRNSAEHASPTSIMEAKHCTSCFLVIMSSLASSLSRNGSTIAPNLSGKATKPFCRSHVGLIRP